MSTRNSKRSANDKTLTIAKPAKQGYKKKKILTPQIITTHKLIQKISISDDKKVASVDELSQSSLTPPRQLSPVLGTRIVFQLLSSPPRQQSPTRIGPQVTTPLRLLSLALESRSIEWLQIAKRHFGDFCNKLVNNIENLIKDFKNTRVQLVSKMTDILNWWLSATNTDELYAHNSIYHLHKFVQSIFAINYISRDTEVTKVLDKLTKNIAVLL
ncbi:4457_t:CDS:2 [Racocetra persica]|uniref:4457_t:CDS:1 n=1 Tax=Racocetra persica TaxID=160502 RepID=A0ACA9L1Y5_9GLOM|nr:4457_t:CDS:2 [Racocetra persica]